MLHHWFGFIHHHNKVKSVEKEQKPKPMKSSNNYALPTKPTMVANNKKLSPTVKATSVNVTIDEITINSDDSNISVHSNEPLRSASISLSIELAKKTSMSSISIQQRSPLFMQKPDTVITPQSSLPKSMVIHKQQQQRPVSVHSSNSLLHRMAHSPKAAAATFPTSVSANGNVVHDSHYDQPQQQHEEEEKHVDNTIRPSSSAAVQSLAKKMEEFSSTHSPPNELSSSSEEEEEEERGTHEIARNIEEEGNEYECTRNIEDEAFDNQEVNKITEQVKTEVIDKLPSIKKREPEETANVDFWTWLGFPSSVNADQTISSRTAEKAEQEVTQPNVETKEQSDDKNITSTSSNIPPTVTATEEINHNVIPNEPMTSVSEPSIISTKRTSWTSFLFQSKPTPATSSTNIPPTVRELDLHKVKSTSSLQPITTTTQSLRSSTSVSSLHHVLPKIKNQVLPSFDSQFINAYHEPSLTTSTSKASSTNFLTKAMDTINSILIQPPPDKPDDTSNWIANRMKAKFSNFVDDLKLHTSSNKPSVMMDKRIVVIGVHGWFPMKVCIGYVCLLFDLSKSNI